MQDFRNLSLVSKKLNTLCKNDPNVIVNCSKDDENIKKFKCKLNYKIKEIPPKWLLDSKRIHTLDLTETGVTDVSMLGNVHTLDLSGTEVTDVSKLGNVHTLNLSFTKVKDVSMLGNVHTINLCVN